MMRPPSHAASRSASSEEFACAAESVSTSRSTELSTAVSIARSFQIRIDGKALGKLALAPPLREHIVSNFFAGNQFSVYCLKFQHSARQQPELLPHRFGNRDLAFLRENCSHTSKVGILTI